MGVRAWQAGLGRALIQERELTSSSLGSLLSKTFLPILGHTLPFPVRVVWGQKGPRRPRFEQGSKAKVSHEQEEGMVKDHSLGETGNLQLLGLTAFGTGRGRTWVGGDAGSHHLCNFSVAASKGPLIKREKNHHDHPDRRRGDPFPIRCPMPPSGLRAWAWTGRLG